MRAGSIRARIFVAIVSCAAFLAASLVPCEPRAPRERIEHAGAIEHPADCEMHASSPSVAAACPCGCGDRTPVAGSSARLGVALPSAPPGCEPPCLAVRAPLAAPMLEGRFVPPIDHVPLPA